MYTWTVSMHMTLFFIKKSRTHAMLCRALSSKVICNLRCVISQMLVTILGKEFNEGDKNWQMCYFPGLFFHVLFLRVYVIVFTLLLLFSHATREEGTIILIRVALLQVLRASSTIAQTGILNWNIGLYAEKTTQTIPYFIKFGHPIKCLKYTIWHFNVGTRCFIGTLNSINILIFKL